MSGYNFPKGQVRDLIRRMSYENPLWGATKIHGVLLKLGIAVAQSKEKVQFRRCFNSHA